VRKNRHTDAGENHTPATDVGVAIMAVIMMVTVLFIEVRKAKRRRE